MKYRYLAVALVAFALASPLSAQSVKAGVEAWQRSDYAGAVAIWRPLAEKGDPDAAFNLGQAYRLGRGVPTNLAAAQEWFERAASKGHVDAETTLGLLLFQNGNLTGGLRWLKLAAEKGEPRAMLVYGTALFNGDGVPQDPIRGYAYVSRSAAQGLEPAKDTLAQMDQVMPVEQRQQGVAMAIAKAKEAPAPTSTPAASPAAAKPGKPAARSKSVGGGAVHVAEAPPKPVEKAVEKPAAKRVAVAPPKPATVAKVAPKPAPAPAKAAPEAASSGAWRIQLGAFSHKDSAEALYRKLSGTLAAHQAYYVAAGPITRLQVGPYSSKAAAQAACSSLHGQACFVVPAK
jgi:TPR repeat protein